MKTLGTTKGTRKSSNHHFCEINKTNSNLFKFQKNQFNHKKTQKTEEKQCH